MPSASKVSVETPGDIPPSVVTGESEVPHGMSTQLGRPTTGRRGSPWKAGSVRHEETPG